MAVQRQDEQLTEGSPPSAPSLPEIFTAFSVIGLSSFGGGLSGWMMREFVERRQWITEREFFGGLALAQAFPGVNVVNLAIWIGYSLRKTPGALASAGGIIVPPMFLAILVISVFDLLARYQVVGALLAGAAAAAIGISIHMGIRATRAIGWRPVSLLVLAATMFALLVMRWPLLPVIVGIAPVSIGLAFWQQRSDA